MSSPNGEPLRIILERGLDDALIRDVVRNYIPTILPEHLPRQRWYGDKHRPLQAVTIIDAALAAAGEHRFVLPIVEVQFADGGDQARYLMLLTVMGGNAASSEALLEIETPDAAWRVAEAGLAPEFPAWWLRQFAEQSEIAGERGRFVWQRLAGFERAAEAAGPGTVIRSDMFQSNTTLRYDDAMFGKIFRRLRAGVNPDEEVTRFLVDHTAFRQLPIPLGIASYRSASGESFPVSVLFSFVPSVDDGWGWAQSVLAAPPAPSDAEAARQLGERTGQLHLALASVPTEPDFAPEPVTDDDIERWEQAVVASLRTVVSELDARAAELSPRLQEMIGALYEHEERLIERAAGFHVLAGTVKTRVHGDYHLSQVLRTPNGDWVMIDFEGEPANTIAERRAKTAPIRDVAGMLRSFWYARSVAARDKIADAGRASVWEREARAAFLAGYRAQVATSAAPLAPSDEAAFNRALAAWDLSKALYEVRYELGNRPDWVDVPLATLIDGDE